MTIGNIVKDERVNVTTSFGNAAIGKLLTKSWSGVDCVTLPPKPDDWNAYSMVLSSTVYTLAEWQILISGSLTDRSKLDTATWTSTPSWPPTIGAVDVLPLWNGIGDKIRGHDFNAGIAAAESFKSFGTLRDGVFRIANSLRRLRKGNIPGALEALGVPRSGRLSYINRKTGDRIRLEEPHRASLAKTWLDMQYGWKPILNDVHAASEAFFAETNRPLRFPFRQFRRNKGAWSLPGGVTHFHKNDAYRAKILHVWLTEAYSPAAGLGLLDPLSVAWELVPFSFVADWFLPIGNYLEARSLSNSLVGEYAYTDFYKAHAIVRDGSFLSEDANALNKKGGAHEKLYISYARGLEQTLGGSFLDGSPVPFPGLKPLGKSLSVPHLLNGMALIREITRG